MAIKRFLEKRPGWILIPFSGDLTHFPLFPSDVLEGKVDAEKVRGKLIFIGSSATASGHLVSTAIDSVFPGVEIQATIAQGIIDSIPEKPTWGRGVAVGLILFLGIICSILFTHERPVGTYRLDDLLPFHPIRGELCPLENIKAFLHPLGVPYHNGSFLVRVRYGFVCTCKKSFESYEKGEILLNTFLESKNSILNNLFSEIKDWFVRALQAYSWN